MTPALTAIVSVAKRVPGVAAWLYKVLGSEGSTGGPDSTTRSRSQSRIVADARSATGELLHRVELEGPNGYDFTARILAWASTEASRGAVTQAGALGPVAAFGLEALRAAADTAGLRPVGISS